MHRSARAAVLGSLSLVLSAAAFAQSGAIYTTNRSADEVNGNLFNGKNHVYLGGGPGVNSSCDSAGLQDGTYYFQVTNPSGSVLLSSDPISNRILVVEGGVVTSHLGSHRTRRGPCNSLIVQLAPFDDTPSSSGNYKVWVTPTVEYSDTGEGFHGFLASASKTDHFKIKGPGRSVDQSIISGYKFYDFTGDGVWDPVAQPLEVPIPGWRIEIYRDGALEDITFTDDTGRYEFIRDLDSTTYEIREVAPEGGFVPTIGAQWVNATPISGTATADAPQVAGPVFGNYYVEQAVGVGRTRGFWSNQNGRDQLALYDPLWREVLGTDADPVYLRRNISSGDPAVSIFTVPLPPTSFNDAHIVLNDWLVGNPAYGHAGFILSVQVGVAILNNTAGFMQGNAYVDRFQNGSLVSFAQMLMDVNNLLSDPNAGLTGPQDGNDALRAAMFACLNEFASINETSDPEKPQIVFLPKSEYSEFASPY